jgi:hypothetical protein
LIIKYGVYYVLYEGLGRKMDWPLWTTLLLLTGIPVSIIVFSLLREYPAHILIKRAGPIALGLYVTASAYLALIGRPTSESDCLGRRGEPRRDSFLGYCEASGVVSLTRLGPDKVHPHRALLEAPSGMVLRAEVPHKLRVSNIIEQLGERRVIHPALHYPEHDGPISHRAYLMGDRLLTNFSITLPCFLTATAFPSLNLKGSLEASPYYGDERT